MTPMESSELIKRLRTEEKVLCPWCKKGHILAYGDKKTTTAFKCNSCGSRININ